MILLDYELLYNIAPHCFIACCKEYIYDAANVLLLCLLFRGGGVKAPDFHFNMLDTVPKA